MVSKLQADGKPRSGLVSAEIAKQHHMAELLPNTGVFVYPRDLKEAQRKDSGSSAARFLLSVFYTNKELVDGRNLTGANNQKGLDTQIIDTIVSYAVLMKSSIATNVRIALRNRISSLVSISKKSC